MTLMTYDDMMTYDDHKTCCASIKKYKFCANFDKIGLVDFALALVPHNDSNSVHTDRYLYRPLFGFFGNLRSNISILKINSEFRRSLDPYCLYT